MLAFQQRADDTQCPKTKLKLVLLRISKRNRLIQPLHYLPVHLPRSSFSFAFAQCIIPTMSVPSYPMEDTSQWSIKHSRNDGRLFSTSYCLDNCLALFISAFLSRSRFRCFGFHTPTLAD